MTSTQEWQAVDSAHYLVMDAMSGRWCVNVAVAGVLAEAAHAQMPELPYSNSFFKSGHQPAIALDAALAHLNPSQFNRVLLRLGICSQRRYCQNDAALPGCARCAAR